MLHKVSGVGLLGIVLFTSSVVIFRKQPSLNVAGTRFRNIVFCWWNKQIITKKMTVTYKYFLQNKSNYYDSNNISTLLALVKNDVLYWCDRIVFEIVCIDVILVIGFCMNVCCFWSYMNKVRCGLSSSKGREINFVMEVFRDGIVGYGSNFKYGRCQIPFWFIG